MIAQAIGQVVPEANNSPVWASAHLLWGNQWGTKNHCCWWVVNLLIDKSLLRWWKGWKLPNTTQVEWFFVEGSVWTISIGLTSSLQRILWRLQGAQKSKSCWQPWRRRWRWRRAWRRPKPSWTRCAARSWGSSRSRQTCIASLFSQWPSAWGRYGVTNNSDWKLKSWGNFGFHS